MTQDVRVNILKGAEAAFFAAMLDGYAGDENRKSVKTKLNNGCTKRIVFQDEENHPSYVVEDEWDTHPGSDKSGGTTKILFQGKPVWRMTYVGHYPERAIPFLKSAIAKAYERKLFLGGRGLASFVDHSFKINNSRFKLEYKNVWGGHFASFDGTERVFQHPIDWYNPNPIGYHKYFGMSLI